MKEFDLDPEEGEWPMSLSLIDGIRVLNDEQIAQAIEELAESVRARLEQGKPARKPNVKDMLGLIETIPRERKYWRSLIARRDDEILKLHQSLKAARDSADKDTLEIRHELNMRILYESNAVANLNTELTEMAHEMEELRSERSRLLARLGEWADAQGIGPGQSADKAEEDY